MDIRIALPDVKLGVIEADQLFVGQADAGLAELMDGVCDRVRRNLTVESLAESAPTRAVRAMFRAWDVDPSKYRPSSEALQRRVVQGKGLYRVSNVVDIGNLGSIETGWPYGCYDRSRLAPPIALRSGAPGEKYEGIGKRVWHLEGRPILADAEGPFGSPISDSTRTMITDAARDILVVIYAPSGTSDASVEAAMARACERLSRFAGAVTTRSQMCR